MGSRLRLAGRAGDFGCRDGFEQQGRCDWDVVLSSITLGGATYTCANPQLNACVFLLETNSGGDVLWSKAFLPDSEPDSGIFDPHVAFAPDGAVLTAGDFYRAVDFGDGLIRSNPAMYLAKYDASGNEVWFYHYGSSPTGNTVVSGLAVDALGRAVVSGSGVSINFGFGIVPTGNFTAQFDVSGVLRWSRGDGGVGMGHFPGSSVALTSSGDVAVALGYSPGYSAQDIGCGAPGGTDGNVLLAVLDRDDGSCLSSRQLGTIYSLALAVDPADDEVVVVGGLAAALDVGSGTLTPRGSSDALLVRLDSALHPLWGKQFGDSSAEASDDVAIDPVTRNIVITGSAPGALDFGAGPVSGPGQLFVAVFTSAGGLVSGDRYGDSSVAAGTGVRYTQDGASIVLGGYFAGSLPLGSGAFSCRVQGTGLRSSRSSARRDSSRRRSDLGLMT